MCVGGWSDVEAEHLIPLWILLVFECTCLLFFDVVRVEGSLVVKVAVVVPNHLPNKGTKGVSFGKKTRTTLHRMEVTFTAA